MRTINIKLLCFLLLFSFTASSQNIITTVAGGGLGGDGGPAISAALDFVNDVYVDGAGNIYIAEEYAIRKVDAATGIITTIAGDGNPGFGCEGCLATQARFQGVSAIAFDQLGNYFIADNGNNRIRKVDAVTNIITTVAGTTFGYSGDGGPATSAQLGFPADICLDAFGNMYIADERYVIRRVDAVTGMITTVAGNGIQGSWTDGHSAVNSNLGGVAGIAFDNVGNLYFADYYNHKIGRISVSGTLSNYCGTGTLGSSGDYGPAVNASIFGTGKIRFNKNDDLFFSDNGVVRQVELITGIISRVAGKGSFGFSGDGGKALMAELANPKGIYVDNSNNLFIADNLNFRIRKVTEVTDISREILPISFDFFPNPSAGFVSVKAGESIKKIMIANMMGQVVYQSHPANKEFVFDIASQPDGVYVLSAFVGGSIITKNVLLRH